MPMRRLMAACAALGLVLGAGGVARAQATSETYVSGVGDDANPCSRTAPCKSFAGALANTLAGGIITVLDPGEFGFVLIDRAITIDGHARHGGIQPATAGITIAAGATDVVALRGLSIIGGAGATNGVTVMSAGLVEIDDSWISGFSDGVAFTPAMGGQLVLDEVVLKDNSDAGVVVGAANGAALATITKSRSEGNGVGIRAVAGGKVGVYDSDVSRNAAEGVLALVDAGGGNAEVNLESVMASGNATGVRAAAAAGSAVVRLSNVMSTSNATAPFAESGGGQVLSFGNNRLDVVPAIALSSTAPSQTVTAGMDATYPIDVGVTGLTAADLAFACSGLPAGASCSFAPMTLPAGTVSGQVVLTVSTTAASGNGGLVVPGADAGARGAASLLLLAFVLLMGGGFLALGKRRGRGTAWRPLGAAIVLVALVGGAAGLTACGSSASTTPDLSMPGGGDDLGGAGDMAAVPDDLSGGAMPTPPGSYAITVTGTSGQLSGSLALTLVVN